MTYPVFQVPAGDVLPVMFSSYAGATGASATLTGLAVTDIEIYKDGSATQRASDAGYTLLDTDGIDFDGIMGIHGFSIDTGDNTDAGFYTVGAWFTVVVSAVTIDSQTVNFIACQFRLMPAESVAGKPKVDTDTFGGTAGTFSSGRPEVNTSHWAGTAVGSTEVRANLINISGVAVSTTTAQLGVNVVQLSGDGPAADNAEAFFDGTGYAGTNNVIPTVTSVTNGVTVTTNNDKSGYSLTAVTGLGDQTSNITGNITGNLSGSVGSVTGAVGSVTGAVGSVSAGGIAAGVLTAGAQNEIADAFLDRNMATGTDSGNLAGTIRTPRQALRVLRNRVNLSVSPFEVYKETDVDVSWTGTLTTAAGDPINQVEPTGP